MSAPISSSVAANAPSVQGSSPIPSPVSKGTPESAPAEPTGDVPKDTVRLSYAAQSALVEAAETPAQTAKEANQGDVQAKHLLAKHAAAKAAVAPPPIHVIA